MKVDLNPGHKLTGTPANSHIVDGTVDITVGSVTVTLRDLNGKLCIHTRDTMIVSPRATNSAYISEVREP